MRPLVALPLVAALAAPAAAGPVDYAREVRPVLRERCYACHGALQQKAKLRVDSGAFLLAAGAVVPGKPDESELLARVGSRDDDTRMPPEGHPLTKEQIAVLRRWVEQGAKVPADDAPEPDPRDHWSFRPVKRPAVPEVRDPKIEVRNPIDAFVAAEWVKRGLTPVGPADKRTLLRRVTVDLTGLPPTADEYAAFLADESPGAYEKVVDRLLASPRYGERWGRHFLDIWRYSDWWGLGAELRNSQKHIWHWRDWTVESLNADVGYDELVRQMLAADELYPTDPKKLRATGYLARSYFLFNRTSWLDEVVEHTGKGFLGLTFNCTKCHDHKYDPISQANYYQLRAVFEPYQVRTDLVPGELDVAKAGLPRVFDCNPDAKTPFHVRGDERNPDPTRAVEPGLPRFLLPNGLKIEPVKLPLTASQPGRRPEVVAAYRAKAEAGLTSARVTAATLDAGRSSAPVGLIARAAARRFVARAESELEKVWKADANPTDPRAALSGAVKARESNVETDESYRRPFPETSTGRRTALALWLTDRSNPLTARVAVNHVWMRHLGTPLVPTVFDFGRKGQPPTHPELLDWLAAELMSPTTPANPERERGGAHPLAHARGSPGHWSLKHLHRLIVTSSVYRLSSSAKDAPAAAADPENRSLWRMNPQRTQAEAVRDALLHLAGDLDPTAGGPPVPPAEQDASRRRSLYFFRSHNEHHKLLDLFDGPSVLDCYRRTESVVPQQALALWNSGLSLAAAEKVAARLPAGDDAAFAEAAFGLVLGATPTEAERAACADGLRELRAALADVPEADRERRARARLVQALLNHNDFVTVR
ncbi:MAG: PSD1 and planctomycete cytochrome C domain-containing protein [Gemmataceae bacterium]|nr:PSD1 and planctomycete cytochrome C domain-containing protein [Gemmataceae bacterium]